MQGSVAVGIYVGCQLLHSSGCGSCLAGDCLLPTRLALLFSAHQKFPGPCNEHRVISTSASQSHNFRHRGLIQHNTSSFTTRQSFTMSNAELASSYAALILADDGVEITADKLQTIIKAAGVADVEPIWTQLFAKALEGKDVKELLSAVGSGGGAAAGPAGAAAGGEAAAADAPAEEKEEEKEESDEDMGFGLFD
ncbi:60s acidic ribosomal protein-domain-containing protein [Xylariaceae sp. FL1019]|nr:60s acidic ribosomal protein-domain-containing protein [Xylariaceae sp. FL1019]